MKHSSNFVVRAYLGILIIDYVVWLLNETDSVLDNNTIVMEIILMLKLNNIGWCCFFFDFFL